MGFIKDFKLGVNSYINAVKFIKEHKLWIYFLFPVLIFCGMYYLGYTFDDLEKEYSVSAADDTGMIKKVWFFLVSGFFFLMSSVIFNFMRYIIIILISPVLSVVSEKVEKIITGNKYKFNLKQLIKDIKRTINLAIRNIFFEFGIVYGVALILYIIFWIVPSPEGTAKFIASQFAMIVAFYYYGFGFIDFMNERRRLTIKESVKFVKRHKGFAIALGLVFTLLFQYTFNYLSEIKDDGWSAKLMFTTIISSIIMAVIPIVTMVAATLGVHELVDLNKNAFAVKKEDKANKSKGENEK
jgi:CysZ protein